MEEGEGFNWLLFRVIAQQKQDTNEIEGQSNNAGFQESPAESSCADEEAVGGSLDDLGSGRVPGKTASGPDGDSKIDEVLGQGLGITTQV